MALNTASDFVTEPSLYLDGLPHQRFARMRDSQGLVWHPYQDNGFWAVTRHADVKTVSRDNAIYSSAIGHTNLWDLEADALEARRSMIDTDTPDHTRLRQIVAAAFTPKSVTHWEAAVRQITADLLDQFIKKGSGDWVANVAAPLPIRVILTMLGVPVQDADYLVKLSNYLVEGTGDTQSIPPDAFGNKTELRLLPFGSPASHALFEYADQLKEQRRDNRSDDLVSTILQAQESGERLSDNEYRNLFHILVFAGNETTRTALSHGAIALADNPDQFEKLVDDPSLIKNATEEILRWSTPVIHMRRTLSQDAQLAGTSMKAGDKVVMWYGSANFDETVFNEPLKFDATRTNSEQYAFGGGGRHMCLGAYLARMEISIFLEEMCKRRLKLSRLSEPTRPASNFVHGVQSVQMAVSTS
jgi:cytochrome P450